jgi:hypothetical protein
MTTLLDGETSAPEAPPGRSRRFKIITALVIAIVLGVVGTGIWALVYINTYQPLSSSPTLFGPATPKTLKVISDGITDSNYILVGPRGTRGTAIYTLSNNGSHSVRIDGLAGSQYFGRPTAKWSPLVPQPETGDYTAGLPTEARSFPTTLRPGWQIVLQLTLTQPDCRRGEAPSSLDVLPLRWSALGVHHVYDFDLTQASQNMPVIVCPPAAALERVDR